MRAAKHNQSDLVAPVELDSERALLAGVLIEPTRAIEVLDAVALSDFSLPEHADIWQAIRDVVTQGERPDEWRVTLAVRKARGEDAAFAVSRLASGVPRGQVLTQIAARLREVGRLRGIFHAARAILAQTAVLQPSLSDVIQTAEAALVGLAMESATRRDEALETVLPRVYRHLEVVFETHRPMRGLETGFPQLDYMTRGLHPSQLVVLAARASIGKSALAWQIAAQVASRGGVRVGVWSLEMSNDELVMRGLIQAAQVNGLSILNGHFAEGDTERLGAAHAHLATLPMVLHDAAQTTVLDIRSQARRMQVSGGLGLIVVDYLGLVAPTTRHENRVQDVSEISRGLKLLAKELHVPVLACAQLNRAIEQRQDRTPKLSDLRDSGAIEQDSDQVWFLTRDDAGRAQVCVAKNRTGPTGEIDFLWDGQSMRFTEAA